MCIHTFTHACRSRGLVIVEILTFLSILLSAFYDRKIKKSLLYHLCNSKYEASIFLANFLISSPGKVVRIRRIIFITFLHHYYYYLLRTSQNSTLLICILSRGFGADKFFICSAPASKMLAPAPLQMLIFKKKKFF